MIKEELKSLIYLDKLINSKLRQFSRLKESITCVKSFDYTKEKVQSDNYNNHTEDLIIKIADLEDEINKDINELVEKRNRARKLFESLKTDEKLIMEMRYLEGKRWEEIAYKTNISIRVVYRLHGTALQKIS